VNSLLFFSSSLAYFYSASCLYSIFKDDIMNIKEKKKIKSSEDI
jgi:hypothetical protein